MDFGSRRTVRVYVSAVLFLFFGVKTVMFFLCTVECYSIIKSVFCISIKAIIWKSANQMKVWDAKLQGLKHIGVRPHKEKINISKEIINKTRRAVAPYAARMNHTPLRGE